MNNNDNIIFFLEEKTQENNNLSEIEKILHELEDIEDVEDITDYKFTNKIYYNEYEELYKECTIKELLKICNYYDIEKNVKNAKYKKQDIISSIVYFESLKENEEIVLKRHKMWSYILELTLDPKMKKYIIWG